LAAPARRASIATSAPPKAVGVADLFDELESVHAGHLEVGDDGGRAVLTDRLEGGLARLGVDRPHSRGAFDDRSGDPTVDEVIIDDQDRGRVHGGLRLRLERGGRDPVAAGHHGSTLPTAQV
jgi:hypothetical protein